MFSPIWWCGIAAVVLAIIAALIWWTPRTGQYRLYATPAISVAALISLSVSLATEA